jgi:hypothetical protein
MRRCPLCASPGIDDRDVADVISDATPDDFDPETDHANAVRIKRNLENEFDVTLTVSETKQHIGTIAQRIRRRRTAESERGGEAA